MFGCFHKLRRDIAISELAERVEYDNYEDWLTQTFHEIPHGHAISTTFYQYYTRVKPYEIKVSVRRLAVYTFLIRMPAYSDGACQN